MLGVQETFIGIKGNLKITIINANTGEVIRIEEGPNLVLNSGLEDLCHLLGGDTTVPEDLVSGQVLNKTDHALPRVPLYAQFGSSSRTPASDDASKFSNGTLSGSATSPIGASDIIKATAYFPSTPIISTIPITFDPRKRPVSPAQDFISNKIVVQFNLPPNKGNGPGGTDNTYKEAVLMSKVSDSPIQYRWFARRVFGDVIKNSNTILAAEWTFTFVVQRS